MTTMPSLPRLLLAPFFALTLSAPAHAFLVNYEFEGLVTNSACGWAAAGDRMSGRLSFNPGVASAADVEHAPGTFDFETDELLLTVDIGPYSFVSRQTTGAGAVFTTSAFQMNEMIFDGGNDWARMHMGVAGEGLFAGGPLTSLEGGQWTNVRDGGWSIETFNEGYGNSVDGRFSAFRYVDAAPNPEPSTMALMALSLAGFGAHRLRRSRRPSLAAAPRR